MNPRDLLLHNIDNYLVAPLHEVGFKYSKSSLKFSRKLQTFEMTIRFCLNRWNSEDNCTFWTMWGVTSNEYTKWYEHEWGAKPANNAIVGEAEWNIPGWSRGTHFALKNSEQDASEFREFAENVINIGIPYFEGITDWTKAIEFVEKSTMGHWLYDLRCDLHLMAGELDKARDVLRQGKEKITQKGTDQHMQLPEIERRLCKYFR